MRKSVGLIGVGHMGHGIAYNLVTKGFTVSLLDHPGNQPLDELVAGGAAVCKTPAQVARQSEVVILCVTGAPQVEAVIAGENGVLQGLQPGAVVIDCSTSLPATTERMGQAVQARGGRFLDAPITRLAKDARAGRLNLLVGGPADVLEAVREVLAAFTEHVIPVGKLGDGHRMKLLHNYVSVGFMTLLAEATAHARQQGVDMKAFVDVLANGGAAGTALQRLAPFMLQDDPSGVPFSLGNATKDLRYYLDMAASSPVHTEVAQGVHATLAAAAQAHPDAYVPELIALLAPRG